MQTQTLHQLLQSYSIAAIEFNSFTFQFRINGVECDINAYDHDNNPIEDTSEITEEIAELLRESITTNMLTYSEIVELFPKDIKLVDFEGVNMRDYTGELEECWEVEIGTDS